MDRQMLRGVGGLVMTWVAALAGTACGGVMLEPTGATSSMGSYSAQYLPVNAIDQSALSAPYVSGLTDFDTFVAATHTVAGGSGLVTWYSSQGVLTGNFDFDLGGSHMIDALVIWADPQAAHQGVNAFNLYADSSPAFSSPVLLGSYTAADGIPDATNVGQVFRFAPTQASNVRMQILSNHGSTFVTGMVEAAFDQVVPEPGVAGLAFALAGLAAAGRRRVRG